MKRYIFILLILLSANTANSDLLDKLGVMTNTNKPDVWKDQLGGYMSGGSIHARVPSTNLQLLSLNLPSIGMGCSGIDLFGGGFGYIDSKHLEALFTQIGSKAAVYSVMLTIKSISPQAADLLENLEAMARFINSQNINDCKMGASIAAGLFPKTQASQQLACQARNMSGSQVSDFFTARYNCTGDKMLDYNDNAQDAILPTEYNLVWEALKKTSLSKADKEFLMSISGTIIAKKQGNSVALENQNTLINDQKMLETLIFGTTANKISLYKCDTEEKCLNPTVQNTKDFKPAQSMLKKIKDLLDSIANKIIQENKGTATALADSEKVLASNTSIPIIKLISLNAGLKGHSVTLSIEDYAEAVAFDYVTTYLNSMIDFVYKALGHLEHTQFEGEVISKFKYEVRYVQKLLANDRLKAYERLTNLISVKKRAQQIETMVLNNFAEYRR